MDNLLKNRAEPAAQGDICLLSEITKALQEAGHSEPEAWLAGSELQTSKGMAPNYQRFFINRYWRRRLGTLTIDTSAERYLLMEQGGPDIWLDIFKASIVPVIVKHNLS